MQDSKAMAALTDGATSGKCSAIHAQDLVQAVSKVIQQAYMSQQTGSTTRALVTSRNCLHC